MERGTAITFTFEGHHFYFCLRVFGDFNVTLMTTDKVLTVTPNITY